MNQDSQPAPENPPTAHGLWAGLRQRLLHGDIGSLPVLLGLILIAVVFQLADPNFLSPLNLTNLLVQIAAVGTIAVGVVLVLLIGEIDLSIGSVSGVTAAIMAVVSVKAGLPGWLAIVAGILSGTLIGLLQGWWIAKLHVPSFVVTLAGFLSWQGALLYVLGSTGTVNLNDPLIVGLSNARLPSQRGLDYRCGRYRADNFQRRSRTALSPTKRCRQSAHRRDDRANCLAVCRHPGCRRHHERRSQSEPNRADHGRADSRLVFDRLHHRVRLYRSPDAIWPLHPRRRRQRRGCAARGHQRRSHSHQPCSS